MTQIVNLSDSLRVVAEYDSGPIDITDVISDSWKVFVYQKARNLRDFSTGDDNGILAEINEQTESIPEFEHRAAEYLNNAGWSHAFVSLQGYSPSEWAEVVIYNSESDNEIWWTANGYDGNAVARDVAKDAKAWFQGDVYNLDLQQAKVYTAADGDTVTLWESLDICGGYLLPDGLTDSVAQEFAQDMGTVY
jgi:hypothetical protein